LNVITGLPSWSLGGVSTFSANLVRGLNAVGARAWVLVTDPYRYDSCETSTAPLPGDVPMEKLPVDYRAGWRLRWLSMIHYLEDHAPCIYLPNYDIAYSCVSPRLSKNVGVIGILHGDYPLYYEQMARLGPFWNAIVAVSQAIATRAAAQDPSIAPRLTTILHGVEYPSNLPQRSLDGSAPLKIVYAGRLVQAEKRILDLPRIAWALAERGAPFELVMIGDGGDQLQVLDSCAPLLLRGVIRFMGTLSSRYVFEIFDQSDVVILTSEAEGMPIGLLEAMGRGCIPVVTDIPSGIPELVQNGVNGFRVPVGDIQAFVERLTLLQRDLPLRQKLSLQAYRTIASGGYQLDAMIRKYLALFERVLSDSRTGAFRRPRGKILPHPDWQTETAWKNILLSASLRSANRAGRHLLNNLRQAGSIF
jgi:glycosyltransferase involved in cell wall biosynthesis